MAYEESPFPPFIFIFSVICIHVCEEDEDRVSPYTLAKTNLQLHPLLAEPFYTVSF